MRGLVVNARCTCMVDACEPVSGGAVFSMHLDDVSRLHARSEKPLGRKKKRVKAYGSTSFGRRMQRLQEQWLHGTFCQIVGCNSEQAAVLYCMCCVHTAECSLVVTTITHT
jgi:hypothetical protein